MRISGNFSAADDGQRGLHVSGERQKPAIVVDVALRVVLANERGKHILNGLMVAWAVLREPFQGVQTAQANFCLAGAELFHSLRVPP